MSLTRAGEKKIKLREGNGVITTDLAGADVVISALAGTYPLKLVPARSFGTLACVSLEPCLVRQR